MVVVPVDMSVVDINYLAVLVAGASYMVVGSLWYSPVMFGNIWQKEAGLSKEFMSQAKQKGMTRIMMLGFGGALITAYVLSHFIDLIGAQLLSDGLAVSGWAWLGFMVPLHLGSVLWEGKSWKYMAINAVHSLVTTLLMGVILTLWV